MKRENHGIKASLMMAVTERRDSLKCVHDLCEFMIENLRELNDTASGGEVLHNQGGIEAYKFLIDAIDNGVRVAPNIHQELKK